MSNRPDPLDTLTGREREVLALMAEGLGNAEIAERLVVTERAVLKHVGNVFGLAQSDPRHPRVHTAESALSRRGFTAVW